jgi:hypothetical protein
MVIEQNERRGCAIRPSMHAGGKFLQQPARFAVLSECRAFLLARKCDLEPIIIGPARRSARASAKTTLKCRSAGRQRDADHRRHRSASGRPRAPHASPQRLALAVTLDQTTHAFADIEARDPASRF